MQEANGKYITLEIRLSPNWSVRTGNGFISIESAVGSAAFRKSEVIACWLYEANHSAYVAVLVGGAAYKLSLARSDDGLILLRQISDRLSKPFHP
nr:hypothetical protein [Nitrosomonas nitrosa]